MKGIDIKELNISMTTQMVELLMKRQEKEIESFKDLLNDKLDRKEILSKLDEYFAKDKIVGFGAFNEEKLVGYMFGQIKFDGTRGKHVWIPYEGIAAEGIVEEIIWKLYAEASKHWLDWGCFSHYVSAPIGDQRYVSIFQRLSFAFEQVHAILDINKYKPFEASEGIKVRLGNKEDADIISGMADIIFSFQNASPVYTPAYPDYVFKVRKGYRGIVDDEDIILLFAEKNGKELGFQEYEPCDINLMVPENAIELSIAGTFATEMGRGVGKKLMNEAAILLKEKGYQYIVNDWRITNISSSTFWPKCGFIPVYYRMQRVIDPRVAWANFNNPVLKR